MRISARCSPAYATPAELRAIRGFFHVRHDDMPCFSFFAEFAVSIPPLPERDIFSESFARGLSDFSLMLFSSPAVIFFFALFFAYAAEARRYAMICRQLSRFAADMAIIPRFPFSAAMF